MRKGSLVTAALSTALAVLTVSACKGKDSVMNDDLARDVALATDPSTLSLAPSTGSQMVVSAEERSPEARPRKAPSARSTRAVPHRTPHRDRVAAHHSTEVASVAAAVVEDAPAAAPTVEPIPTENAPVADSPRPHPVAVGTSYPGSANGSGNGSGNTGRGGGISIGDVIGVIGAVVIRGGTVDGDHCDPRADRRRRGGPDILVNNRGGPVLRGNW